MICRKIFFWPRRIQFRQFCPIFSTKRWILFSYPSETVYKRFWFKKLQFFDWNVPTDTWNSLKTLCEKFDTKIRINSVSKSKIKGNTQFFRNETCLSWKRSSGHFEHSFGNTAEFFFPDFEISSEKFRKKINRNTFFSGKKIRL